MATRSWRPRKARKWHCKPLHRRRPRFGANASATSPRDPWSRFSGCVPMGQETDLRRRSRTGKSCRPRLLRRQGEHHRQDAGQIPDEGAAVIAGTAPHHLLAREGGHEPRRVVARRARLRAATLWPAGLPRRGGQAAWKTSAAGGAIIRRGGPGVNHPADIDWFAGGRERPRCPSSRRRSPAS